MSERNVESQLEEEIAGLREQLDEQGGRGIELANEIDRLQLALDALQGELFCPQCEARLTSED